MNIPATKIKIVEQILKTDNPKILNQLLSIVKSENEDFWHELTPYEQKEIQESLNELNDGKRVSYEKVMKKYKK